MGQADPAALPHLQERDRDNPASSAMILVRPPALTASDQGTAVAEPMAREQARRSRSSPVTTQGSPPTRKLLRLEDGLALAVRTADRANSASVPDSRVRPRDSPDNSRDGQAREYREW